MFKRWEPEKEKEEEKTFTRQIVNDEKVNTVNTILKGSKLTGDINITCDLELSGDVKGNITSEKNSNIVIKGSCKGNIETREGNVSIEGEMKGGNITAGGNVKISGKFNGGVIKANGKIFLNGEFKGKSEGNEIEIGSEAQCSGELLYKEHISIERGAEVEGQISQVGKEIKETKKPSNSRVVNIKPPVKEMADTTRNDMHDATRPAGRDM
jgi:cytoskeletal protein CcmA (bactofilin family)